MRDPVEEVDGPVERIDEPPDPGPAARARAFLRDDAVVRPPRAKVSDDGPLGALVRLRDEIGRARLGANARGRAAEALNEQLPRRERRLDPDGDRFVGAQPAQMRCAPGRPSSIAKLAIVLTLAVGWRTVETARKSAVRRLRSIEQRT